MICTGKTACCVPARRNRSEPATPTTTNRPTGAKPKAVRVNPGTVLVQARPTGITRPRARSINHDPNSFYVLKDDPVLTGTDINNPQQSFDEGAGGTASRTSRSASPATARSVFESVTKRNRRTAARKPAAGRQQGSSAAALRGRARRPADHGALDRLHPVPGRDRRRPTARRSPAASRSPRRRTSPTSCSPARCRSSSKLISDSQVSATLGKQALNQGLIAGLVGLRRRVPVPARLLPRARRDRGRRPGRSTAIYFFALIKLIPITLTLPGIAGLILTIGVAADANIVIFERVKEEIRGGRSVISGDRDRLQTRLRGDRRRERRDVHDRVHPVRAGDRRSQGLRVHARHRHARVAVHGGARHAGGARRDGRSRLVTHPSALGAGGESAQAGRSTSWAPRSGSSRCRA